MSLTTPLTPAPNERIALGFSDQDNFVRNLVTILLGGGTYIRVPTGDPYNPYEPPPPEVMKAALEAYAEYHRTATKGKDIPADPVVTLDQIKDQCRIDSDQTAEDAYLGTLGAAAQYYVQNYIRVITLDSTAPEDIKLAVLLLVGHWYRNREAVTEGLIGPIPLGVTAILSQQRRYDPTVGVY